ncbi:5481_t:CDS:2, partial [Paraglomus occultum]
MPTLIHEYFNRKHTEWSITEYLNESNEEPFQLKIDVYLKSLANIIKSDHGKRRDRARDLLAKEPRPDYELARRWEKERSRKQVYLHQPTINGTVSGPINGAYITGTVSGTGVTVGTVGGTGVELSTSKKRDQEVEATSSLINITKETFATTIGNVHSAVENINDTLRITGGESVTATNEKRAHCATSASATEESAKRLKISGDPPRRSISTEYVWLLYQQSNDYDIDRTCDDIDETCDDNDNTFNDVLSECIEDDNFTMDLKSVAKQLKQTPLDE